MERSIDRRVQGGLRRISQIKSSLPSGHEVALYAVRGLLGISERINATRRRGVDSGGAYPAAHVSVDESALVARMVSMDVVKEGNNGGLQQVEAPGRSRAQLFVDRLKLPEGTTDYQRLRLAEMVNIQYRVLRDDAEDGSSLGYGIVDSSGNLDDVWWMYGPQHAFSERRIAWGIYESTFEQDPELKVVARSLVAHFQKLAERRVGAKGFTVEDCQRRWDAGPPN